MSRDNINKKITNLENNQRQKKNQILKTRKAGYLWNKGIINIQGAKETY